MLETALRELLEREIQDEKLLEMAKYCVLDGGKRIRPRLCLMTVQMLGGSVERALPFACAIELIHAYSLVHDDLPAMDNDDFRRGKPSCHKRFGVAEAILTGDALLTLAALALSRVEGGDEAKAEIFRAALLMVEGQRYDLCETVDSEAKLLELYRKKTGALMLSGILCAAKLEGCTAEQYNKLKLFGEKLGLLFQLTDDVLDGDQRLVTAEDRIKDLADEALAALEDFPASEELKTLVVSIKKRSE